MIKLGWPLVRLTAYATMTPLLLAIIAIFIVDGGVRL
jgi:hypothetical protein